MSELICPRCRLPVDNHSEWGSGSNPSLYCPLSESQATRLAQRRKAAERVAQYIREGEGDTSGRCQDGIDTYVEALRDTGILGDGESEAELLKEMEGETK